MFGSTVVDNPKAQNEIEELASTLESLNPTPIPTSSLLLGGDWRLVYTTSRSIIGAGRPKPFRPIGEVYQAINVENLTAENRETIAPLPFIKFLNKVQAKLTVQSSTRVLVQFTRFFLGPISFAAPDTARGTLDITYLDETMRVSRGNKNNLFVLVKDQ
eukprot:CAMPEP_0184675612 /NCGR_PEP_ID=MMETSP0308-20130426/87883_1 /TAXON_ID=38269 /ORGANISM="Gloeochaete witrockiana, Strain SAG 46.84" /LENGTH=158 /DNA_ID=CAMNT_0027123331 /DNA_START=440 /DNA_END=916 /DNA_ORIENTATION=-